MYVYTDDQCIIVGYIGLPFYVTVIIYTVYADHSYHVESRLTIRTMYTMLRIVQAYTCGDNIIGLGTCNKY